MKEAELGKDAAAEWLDDRTAEDGRSGAQSCCGPERASAAACPRPGSRCRLPRSPLETFSRCKGPNRGEGVLHKRTVKQALPSGQTPAYFLLSLKHRGSLPAAKPEEAVEECLFPCSARYSSEARRPPLLRPGMSGPTATDSSPRLPQCGGQVRAEAPGMLQPS